METRILGRTGIEVGVVGMGVEHLNETRENMDAVFEIAAESGVNCIDLVYNDPTRAHAEHWRAIGPGVRTHRESLILCLHWGFVQHEPIKECQRSFDAALEAIGDGYVEIAMVPLVDTEEIWQGWAQESIKALRQYQKDGRVGYIGLSNHRTGVAKTAVESGLIDVLMFPVNLYQHPPQGQGAALLETCEENDVGVIAMKPYYGGKLISSYGQPTEISPAECLHYVLSQPVATVVPGVQNADHMREAVEAVEAPAPQLLDVVVGEDLAGRLKGQCVQCKHCLPCTVEINIPEVIRSIDYLDYYSGTNWSKGFNTKMYERQTVKASACTDCGVCVDRCPFDVDIPGKMRRAAEVLD